MCYIINFIFNALNLMKISEIWHGIVFESINFRLWDFFGIFFLPPFDHPCHLKSQYPPPPSHPLPRGQNLFERLLKAIK